MRPADLVTYCRGLPHATEDIKWGKDMCYSVGGKMFAVMGDHGMEGASISFKVDDHRFLELTDGDRYIPAPYLARAKWVYVKDVRKIPEAELKPLLTRSYEIIRDKLPKSKRP